MANDKLVFIAGSPTENSRSTRLLEAVATEVRALGTDVRTYSLGDFEPRSLLYGDTSAESIQAFIRDVIDASGIAVSTPVYKAALTGALKATLDVIPPDALVGKVALAIATARQPAHLDSAGRSLSSVFDFFRIRAVAAPVLIPDASLFDPNDPTALHEETVRATRHAARELHSLI